MAYKDSNHTVVHCIVLVLKLTSVVELRFRRPPLLKRLLQIRLAIQLSWKTHKDSGYTAMIVIMHWRLRAENHPGVTVVSTVIVHQYIAIYHSALTYVHICILIYWSIYVLFSLEWALESDAVLLQRALVPFMYSTDLEAEWSHPGSHTVWWQRNSTHDLHPAIHLQHSIIVNTIVSI